CILRLGLLFQELRFRSMPCSSAPRARRLRLSTRTAKCICVRSALGATSEPRSKFLAGSTPAIRSSSTRPTRSKKGSRCTLPSRPQEMAAREARTSPRRHGGTEKSKFMISFLIEHLRLDNAPPKKPSSVSPCLRGGFCVLLAAALLTGCTVGPRYKRPTAQVPGAWKGEGPWQAAAPKDAIPKGTWWQIFHDAELDRLEHELLLANQSLAAARDRLSEARSQARIASAAYFPAATADPSGQRQELS